MTDSTTTTSEYDVIVVGSGGSGLVAACAAADRGLTVCVFEASELLGGTTALSGGQLWIPGSGPQRRAGFSDDPDDALHYLERNALGSASAPGLRSFIDNGPLFVDYLENELGVSVSSVDRPDYHPGWPGAAQGRTVEPLPVSTAAIAGRRSQLRFSPDRAPITSTEGRQGIDPKTVAERIQSGVRTQGAGLVAGLVRAALQRNVEFATGARVIDLQQGAVAGVWTVVTATGLVAEAASVVLAAGGFAANAELRRDFLPLVEILPTGTAQSQGDGIALGTRAGARLHGMGEAWWTAAAALPENASPAGALVHRNVVRELAYPGSILVNRLGRRFVDEASSYNDLGKAFYEFDPATHSHPNEQAWLLFDARFRATRTVLGVLPTDSTPNWMLTAPSLRQLAAKLSIDPDLLVETTESFNHDALRGIDTLFGRGDNAHDRFNGDTDTTPNACLGPILEAPFFAVALRLGANGTQGGLLTDDACRVIDYDQKPIAGLFAVGENASALMGPGYAGSGASLGPALTAAYVLARHLPPPCESRTNDGYTARTTHHRFSSGRTPLVTYTDSTPTLLPRPKPRVIIAACFGHAVEWFEFGVYGYLAVVIGGLFFPSDNPATSVLSALAVFGVAFFARPVGAVFFGNLGDRFGRKAVLSTTILLMGGATAAIGLLPTYAVIGVFAPMLLILLRLIQGLSAGGETSGAATFLAESAPEGKRALWTSSIQAIGIIAFVCASSLVAALTSILGPSQMAAWGWRIPFLLSFPLALVGLYLRFKVEETPAFKLAVAKEQAVKQKVPIRLLLTSYKKPLLLLIAIVMVEAVASYVAKTYASTYLVTTIGLDSGTALLSTSITLLFAAALVPFYAILSDRIGRKPLLIGGTIGLMVLAVPAFLLIGTGSLVGAVIGQVIAIIPGTAISVAVVVAQAELFPTPVRYSGAAVGYNVAYALFGGTAPYIAAALVAATGVILMPAFYLIVIGCIGLFAMVRLPETYRKDLTSPVAVVATEHLAESR